MRIVEEYLNNRSKISFICKIQLRIARFTFSRPHRCKLMSCLMAVIVPRYSPRSLLANIRKRWPTMMIMRALNTPTTKMKMSSHLNKKKSPYLKNRSPKAQNRSNCSKKLELSSRWRRMVGRTRLCLTWRQLW